MKLFFRITLILAAVFTLVNCSDNNNSSTKEYTHEFKTSENDFLNVLEYELENGLKVFISVNKDEPRVQTNIAVRTGSKNDPSDATGLAHYLEHMLFKGTSNIGSLDWEKEKVLLQQISDAYEEHRNTKDEDTRREIYGRIDSLSQEAAKYVATNEYDKLVSSLGAQGTNAYTWLERTVYINDIPSNELEKWMQIESERFGEVVLRLFHTELEAVYEEFNRAQDSDWRLAYYEMMRNLFKKHTYGTQSTIGTGEHLKNPSMVKIHEYFDQYYVPNNMAIILCGDVDPDATVEMIEKYFGRMEAKPVTQFTCEPEDEITEPIVKDVYGSDKEFVNISYRLGGVKSDDYLLLDLIDLILSNGNAGLIDLDLVQKQKVLSAYSSVSNYTDYSIFTLHAEPRDGQTLNEAKTLVLAELEKIKNGEFEDWMIEAIVKDAKLSQLKQAERNGFRAYDIVSAFIWDIPWSEKTSHYDKMAKLTKEDVMNFAKEKFKNNYVAINKKIGNKDVYKVDKPAITEVPINRDTSSVFAQKMDSIEPPRITAEFVNYDEKISRSQLKDGIKYSHINNETNKLFSLFYILDQGSDQDKELALAIKYLPYLGTSKYSPEELQKEFFKLGIKFNVNADRDKVYVYLNGLDESFEEGVKLFEEVLADVQADSLAYQNMVKGIIKERANAKLNKFVIHRRAMGNYAKYGENSPMKNILSTEELNAVDPNSLTEKIKGLTGFEHQVFYYGTKDESSVKEILERLHNTPDELKPNPAPVITPELDMNDNQVFFVDYDMVQTEILMISKVEPFNRSKMAQANIFNEFFGSGLSSIVFQEIRESKALAYSAYSYYTTPSKKEESHYVNAYIGCQTDKLPKAVDAMLELMNNMPEAEKQYEQAKLAALKQMETNRTTKTSIFWSAETAKNRGLEKNVQPEIYEAIKNMELTDVKAFFDSNIKGRNFTFLVIGKKSDVDMEALAKLGNVTELSLEDIFGY